MSRTKRTMIFSQKAYTGKAHSEKVFAKNVLETVNLAKSQEEHVKLLQEIYPTYHIEPLYTYEHGMMKLERTPSCRFDSSNDGMVAFKQEKELEKEIEKINNYILGI